MVMKMTREYCKGTKRVPPNDHVNNGVNIFKYWNSLWLGPSMLLHIKDHLTLLK